MIIGIGTDIIEISRVERALQKTESFYKRVYTERERAYYISNRKKTESLAGLFCAKEAVSKALGTGFRGFGLGDIEIVPNKLGKPEVTLLGEAAALAKSMGIKRIHISISHSQSYAASFAVAEGDDIHEVTNTCSNEPSR